MEFCLKGDVEIIQFDAKVFDEEAEHDGIQYTESTVCDDDVRLGPEGDEKYRDGDDDAYDCVGDEDDFDHLSFL